MCLPDAQRQLDEKADAWSTHCQIFSGSDNVDSADGEDSDEDELRVVQTVIEPRTGAVGHLPALGPGEVFEYMSGADTGQWKGSSTWPS